MAYHFTAFQSGPGGYRAVLWSGALEQLFEATLYINDTSKWPVQLVLRQFVLHGCMRVIPGSHANGFSDYHFVDASHNTFDREVNNVDESQAVYFELEPGECSLHDSRILHGANANTSPFRRCGYTMRYMAASTKIIPETNLNHKCWLAHGRNLAGNKLENVPS